MLSLGKNKTYLCQGVEDEYQKFCMGLAMFQPITDRDWLMLGSLWAEIIFLGSSVL